MNVFHYVLSIAFQKNDKKLGLDLFGKQKKIWGAHDLESNPKYINKCMKGVI